MADISVHEAAAVDRLAGVLAPLVTNRMLTETADYLQLTALSGSSKAARLRSLLHQLLLDGRRRSKTSAAIASLVMGAHAQSVDGKIEMFEDEVEAIVGEMRGLGFEPGQLAHKRWRTALKMRSASGTISPEPTRTEPPRSSPRQGPVVGPTVHVVARQHLATLLTPNVNPHTRGRQLESIVVGVLQHERLQPERNIVMAGEQLDVSFVLEGHHYLVECKWEAAPVGLPEIHLFAHKVATKAEGTFGVVLSMSGFVSDINPKASRGTRLNCIGLTAVQFMDVIEGRTTWSALVREARRLASTRSLFAA